MKRKGAALIAAVMLGVWMFCLTGFADTRIGSLSIKFTSDGYEDSNRLDVEMTVSNEHCYGSVYSAMDYADPGIYWNDPAVYVVELRAEDEYYFPYMSADRYRVSGLGAKFLEARRVDSGEGLVIFVRFTRLGDHVGQIAQAYWTDAGRGAWTGAVGAKMYEVSIDVPTHHRFTAQTIGTSYDFSPYMQTPGEYTFKVHPIAQSGKGGVWTQPVGISVSAEQAEANKAMYEVRREITSSSEIVYLNTGWQTGADGRLWYRNTDGSYIQENWLPNEGNWYYFGADGYMKTNTFITYDGKDYYMGADGKMLTAGQAPDGRLAAADGTLYR